MTSVTGHPARLQYCVAPRGGRSLFREKPPRGAQVGSRDPRSSRREGACPGDRILWPIEQKDTEGPSWVNGPVEALPHGGRALLFLRDRWKSYIPLIKLTLASGKSVLVPETMVASPPFSSTFLVRQRYGLECFSSEAMRGFDISAMSCYSHMDQLYSPLVRKGNMPQMIQLSKSSPLPIYYQLKEALREQIESGALKPHERLLSERELGESYNISRMTARQALSKLEVAGYIYRRQGKGSFVAEPKIRQGLLRLSSFTEDMRQRGLSPGARVLSVELISTNADLIRRFQAEANEQFVKIQRIRLADGEPMALEFSSLRHKFCPGIEELDFTDRSIYETLRERYNIYLGCADQTIEVKSASEYEAQVLNVKQGAPMWQMERLTYLEDRRTVIEYVRSAYRGDRYKLYAELDRRRR